MAGKVATFRVPGQIAFGTGAAETVGGEAKRGELPRALAPLGDFRRGTISVNYRKCGKRNCACARADHPGHGPQYLWNATIGGRSRARNLRLGPEPGKVGREVDTYRTFARLCRELVAVNEQLCQLRPVREVANPRELAQLKKNCSDDSPGSRRGPRPPSRPGPAGG